MRSALADAPATLRMVCRSRSRGLLRGFALFAASTGASLVALEAVFRIFFPQPLYAVSLAPWGLWHEGNASFTHAAEAGPEGLVLNGIEFVTHISYDSAGIRGPEYAPAKPAGTRRIVVLGDSYGEALEVEFEQTFSRLLERKLNDSIAALRAGPRPPPLPIVQVGDGLSDPEEWPITRALWLRLRDDAREAGAAVLAANVLFTGPIVERRRPLFAANGIAWVDLLVPAAEHARYHYEFDGHWNPAGHERAAGLLAAAIDGGGLLAPSDDLRQVEVLNLSVTASSLCQQLMVFDAVGRLYSPDLVLVIDTGTDTRNLSTRDLCDVDRSGRLTITPRTYSPLDGFVRGIRTAVRGHSHFLTFLLERYDAIRGGGGGDVERVPVPGSGR